MYKYELYIDGRFFDRYPTIKEAEDAAEWEHPFSSFVVMDEEKNRVSEHKAH